MAPIFRSVEVGFITIDFYQTHATGAYYNSENLTHPTHATFQAFYMQAGTGLTSFLLNMKGPAIINKYSK